MTFFGLLHVRDNNRTGKRENGGILEYGNDVRQNLNPQEEIKNIRNDKHVGEYQSGL